jgi:hypothetical protein
MRGREDLVVQSASARVNKVFTDLREELRDIVDSSSPEGSEYLVLKSLITALHVMLGNVLYGYMSYRAGRSTVHDSVSLQLGLGLPLDKIHTIMKKHINAEVPQSEFILLTTTSIGAAIFLILEHKIACRTLAKRLKSPVPGVGGDNDSIGENDIEILRLAHARLEKVKVSTMSLKYLMPFMQILALMSGLLSISSTGVYFEKLGEESIAADIREGDYSELAAPVIEVSDSYLRSIPLLSSALILLMSTFFYKSPGEAMLSSWTIAFNEITSPFYTFLRQQPGVHEPNTSPRIESNLGEEELSEIIVRDQDLSQGRML